MPEYSMIRQNKEAILSGTFKKNTHIISKRSQNEQRRQKDEDATAFDSRVDNRFAVPLQREAFPCRSEYHNVRTGRRTFSAERVCTSPASSPYVEYYSPVVQ